MAEDDQPFWRSNKKEGDFVCKLFNFKLFSFSVGHVVFNFYLIPIMLAVGNLISGLAGLYVFIPIGPVDFYTFDKYLWILWFFLPDCGIVALLYIYFFIDYKRIRTGFTGKLQHFLFGFF